MRWTTRKILRFIWVLLGISFTVWMWYNYQAKGVQQTVFESNAQVQIKETKDAVSFTPTHPYQKVFIFYPGALADPYAYAPLCRTIADSGYKVWLVKMPWRLASKGYNKPKELGLLNDTTKQYILAGHSQGAKMAAQFVYENPGLIDRLILLGTTHPRDIDLSKAQIPILKIAGSKDGVASMKDIILNKSKLPSTTKYVVIEGANHAQFGYYGWQLGDGKATITRAQQQQMVIDSILAFIK
jgi:triacylglycerol esterase/lipase EstA (alpha/beta hydrolase family)